MSEKMVKMVLRRQRLNRPWGTTIFLICSYFIIKLLRFSEAFDDDGTHRFPWGELPMKILVSGDMEDMMVLELPDLSGNQEPMEDPVEFVDLLQKRSRTSIGDMEEDESAPSAKYRKIEYTPFMLWEAVRKNDVSEASKILAQFSDTQTELDRGALVQLALAAPDRQMIRLFLSHGLDPDSTIDYIGSTLLFDAIHKRDRDLVRLLLGTGASVNRVNQAGLTPILIAASLDDVELIRILFNSGADPNLGFGWKSPLTTAIEKKDFSLTRALILGGEARIDERSLEAARLAEDHSFYRLLERAQSVRQLSESEAKRTMVKKTLAADYADIMFLYHLKLKHLMQGEFAEDFAKLVVYRGDSHLGDMSKIFKISLPSNVQETEINNLRSKYSVQ